MSSPQQRWPGWQKPLSSQSPFTDNRLVYICTSSAKGDLTHKVPESLMDKPV